MCVCVRRRLPPRSTRTDTLVPYTTRFRSAPSGSSSTGTRWRSKKTAHASEQERPDVLARRRAWFKAQPDLDPERLVFIDETGASTKMARPRGRRSEEHTSELQSLMRISYAVFCLKKKTTTIHYTDTRQPPNDYTHTTPSETTQ